MNEAEFLEKWNNEKPIYAAWGNYILDKVKVTLSSQGRNLEEFFKVSPSSRIKDDDSLVDKAFYRNKSYDNPYREIEDKVGVRFVVLLVDEIREVCDVIENEGSWTAISCRDFDKEKEADPLLFTYQSMHYVLRPNGTIQFSGVEISGDKPCEVQIRTLLQHAHAELTHDTIYKARSKAKPEVHRTVAKSMALIETTDDFFGEVTTKLRLEALERYNVVGQLDEIYQGMSDKKSKFLKSSLIIWDTFESFITESLVSEIAQFVESEPTLGESINNHYEDKNIYKQGVILMVYWMLTRHRAELLRNWPLPLSLLQSPANDLGININPT